MMKKIYIYSSFLGLPSQNARVRKNAWDSVSCFDSQDRIHRILGIQRNSSTDQITYKLDRQSNKMAPRGILSAGAFTSDPQGIISPILITGKALLQQYGQVNLEWDKSLSPRLLKQ